MRIILSMLIFINISYASSARYFIKLGSFKNLRGLERSIYKMPNALRSHVLIVRRNSWYVPFAYYLPHKKALYKYLPRFKHYFPDAQIQESLHLLNYPVIKSYMPRKKKRYIRREAPAVSNRQSLAYHQPIVVPHYQNVGISEEDNTLNQSREMFTSEPLSSTVVSRPVRVIKPKVVAEKRYKSFNKKMLSGKHYYLAYKSIKNSPDLLIKVSFKNHRVVYQPIIGEMQMVEANYLIENRRLYMFTNSFTQDGAYSILEKNRKNYFLVSSWINGKKLNTLRYYFNLNDAKEYLNLRKSNGLAHTLEEGTFDDFFLNNDY